MEQVTKLTTGAAQHGNCYIGRVFFYCGDTKLSFFETCVDVSATRNDAIKEARKLKKKITKNMNVLSVEFINA